MLISSKIKKEKFFVITGLIFLFFIMFACYSMISQANQRVVVISPGHSLGYDPGASSVAKCEAQVNQELAGRVVRLLNAKGYKVYITHTTDAELASQKLLSQEAGSYLKNVADAIDNIHPDLSLVLHHNSGGTASSGYELYWSSYRDFDGEGLYTVPGLWGDGSPAYRDSSPSAVAQASNTFANIIHDTMAGIPNLSFRKIVERDDYVPSHVTCPSVLYEGGYLSNPTEAQYLASDQYLTEASNRLVNAIDAYFGGAPSSDNEPPKINNVYSSATETGAVDYSVECNATDNVGISSVKFATWTDANGQDDIIWTEGTNNGNGNYSAIISTKDHNYEHGNYVTHVYAYDNAGNFVGAAAPTVNIQPFMDLKTGVSIEKLTSSLATVYANNLGASGYKFAIWSEDSGQDDLIWKQGEQQLGSCFKTTINRAEHNNASGKYLVHCYSNDGKFVGANEVNFGRVEAEKLEASMNGNHLMVNVLNLHADDPIQGVLVAVWSEDNGQDDLNWYSAGQNGSNWSLTQDISGHTGSGTYNVHVYVNDVYGNMRIVGGTVVNYPRQGSSSSSIASSSASVGALQGSQFSVSASNVPGNYKALVAVWSEVNGQDDLVWYGLSDVGNGNFQTTIDVNRHTGSGTYYAHVYLQSPTGELTNIKEATLNVPETVFSSSVTVNTPIMGKSDVTAAELSNMYNAHAGISFPDYYVARGVSLGQFAQFYIDEANAEGVRADIAFSQAMLETGFLNFGGDVSISQFNFAGLGATGNGVPGENFAAKYGDNANGIRMGIRAQIQHLKAYASTDPLNQECVDARYDLVSPHGKAPTINGLTGTWAVDKTYAPKIVTIANYI